MKANAASGDMALGYMCLTPAPYLTTSNHFAVVKFCCFDKASRDLPHERNTSYSLLLRILFSDLIGISSHGLYKKFFSIFV